MKTFTLYDRVTGIFTPSHYSVSESAHVVLHETKELAAMEGHFNALLQKVDVETTKVVAYQPPPLSEEQLRLNKRRAALQQIAQLEVKQPRIIREMMLKITGAFERLQDIENQIIELRRNL
jgi:hypothetical protein